MKPEYPHLTRWLEASGALQQGHFLLSSGLHSAAYVQCARLLEVPERARRLGLDLAELVRKYEPGSILSPALGGLIIGYEVASSLAVPFRFVERAGSEMALRRGFSLSAGERVVVVEDVVTTGRSTREAARAAKVAGAKVCAIACILDRTAGRHRFGVPFERLLELEFANYESDSCPLCADGDMPVKPGSRPVS